MSESALSPLMQRMLQADFYPHAVTEPIQLVQTHVSFVFLTGKYAYKVKKPVNFGFLDFSTLEKRQHFCHEELRMNQRSAPELYLEVLPIAQTGTEYDLGNDGEVVEYALKMRQFPQQDLFIDVFERGELTESHMMELGQTVARFHAKAEINGHIRSFGTVEKIRIAIDENYEQTNKYIGGPQTQEQYLATKAYTDQFFAGREAVFEQRVAEDKIRECHGDLHLRNICFYNGKIVLFDCIEFNEPFRFVDVMYDVAFTVMDLEARDRTDLGNAFLNTYVEETGDWEGLQVLPLYLSRQAYVRAKVTSFLLDDPAIPAEVKQSAQEGASHYYHLAWQYTQPRQGQIFVMAGLSGSGKSTTARQVARSHNAIQIRSDAVRKHLGGVALSDRGGPELYTPEMTQKTYQRLLDLGVLLANQGFNVILDAKYDREVLRQAVFAAAQAHQIPVKILHCTAPLEVLQARVQQRTGDIADATVEVLAKQTFEPFTAAEQPYVVTVDTTQDLPPQLAAL